MSQRFYVGDVGVAIRVRVFEDDADDTITGSGVTGMKLQVLKPGATAAVDWTAVADGEKHVKYVTQAGDLNVQGSYSVHVVLTAGTAVVYSNRFSVPVYEPHAGPTEDQ